MKNRRIIMTLILSVLFTFMTGCSGIEEYDDIAGYEERLASSGKDKWRKWDMDESIWPAHITDSMDVQDYRMVYYDPFDAQYLGYLVIEYMPEDYRTEMERLSQYPSDDCTGIYCVTGEKDYELAAVRADPYYGFVYALTDGESKIIYCEEIFCNYFMDLDYTKYIPQEYLLDGFDATENNPYRKEMME